jgi:hypothetical protein
MPRVCTVCSHSLRRKIDTAIVFGKSNRTIAAHFRLKATSIQRHKKHVAAALVRATKNANSPSVRASSFASKISTSAILPFSIQPNGEKTIPRARPTRANFAAFSAPCTRCRGWLRNTPITHRR